MTTFHVASKARAVPLASFSTKRAAQPLGFQDVELLQGP